MVIIKEERCVVCGEIIPEGTMVCVNCRDIEPSFDTAKTTIRLNNSVEVIRFSNLVSKCKDDVVVKSGHFAVNAKSMSALYSIDLTKTLDVEFYGYIPAEVQEGMKQFIII